MGVIPEGRSFFLVDTEFKSFFTVCKRSCGKVMFLHLSVSHSVHSGVGGLSACWYTPPRQTPLDRNRGQTPPGQTPPPPGRRPLYASYWNAFLYFIKIKCTVMVAFHQKCIPVTCWELRYGFVALKCVALLQVVAFMQQMHG